MPGEQDFCKHDAPELAHLQKRVGKRGGRYKGRALLSNEEFRKLLQLMKVFRTLSKDDNMSLFYTCAYEADRLERAEGDTALPPKTFLEKLKTVVEHIDQPEQQPQGNENPSI